MNKVRSMMVLSLMSLTTMSYGAVFKGNVTVTLEQMGVPMNASLPLQGDIVYEGDNVKNIIMKVSTSGLKTSSGEARDAAIGSLWLSSSQYPISSFKSTEIKPITSMGDYSIKGLLTIKNKTKPIEFKAHIAKKEASAIVTLNRLDYDLGIDMWKDVKVVSNKVQLNMKGQYE